MPTTNVPVVICLKQGKLGNLWNIILSACIIILGIELDNSVLSSSIKFCICETKLV